MSNRAGGGGVRGPTSALTEFLREKNIHISNANRFARAEPAQENAAATPAPIARESVAGPSQPSPSTRSSRQRMESSTLVPSPQKRKKFAPKGASMKFDEDEDDEWFSEIAESETADEDEDVEKLAKMACTSSTGAVSAHVGDQSEDGNNAWLRIRKGEVVDISRKAATAGTIDYCPGCTNRFTITNYTVQTASGGLCHRCAPEYNEAVACGSGLSRTPSKGKCRSSAGPLFTVGPSTNLGLSPQKPVQRRKKTIVEKPQDKKVLPTLQDMCINIISEHIEDVEALGGIGDRNIDALSKSISKNRRLNDQTVQLFLEPHTTTLSLYDCSRLSSDSLRTIGVFSPRICALNLQQCGQLDNTAFDAWTKKLTCLESLELYGPFLVRKEAWLRFFDKVGDRLKSLKLRETPRFDLECAKRLVQMCPGLQELGLAQIGPLDGACLKPLHLLSSLTYLDVSDPGVAVSGIPPKGLDDDDVIELLFHIGSRLRHLNLGGNANLTDRVILEGILPFCMSLHELRLEGLENVESDALVLLFNSMAARNLPKLTWVDLKRCRKLQDDSLAALVAHSGPALQILNLNSCSLLTGSVQSEQQLAAGSIDPSGPSQPPGFGLQLIARGCPSLQKLDVGFVRTCGVAEIMALIKHCEKLELVHVFGCNRIPDYIGANPAGPNGATRCRVVGLERVPIIPKNVTT